MTLKILGSGSAHPSHDTVKTCLSKIAATQEVCNAEEDTIIAYDNNQVLQKRGKVKLRNHCNILTVVFFISLIPSSIQFNTELKPINWEFAPLGDMGFIRYPEQDAQMKNTHYQEFLFPWIQSIIIDQTSQNSRSLNVIPCSYEAVAAVLRNIGRKAGIEQYGGSRLLLCAVASPSFSAIESEEPTMCSICQLSVDGLKAGAAHKRKIIQKKIQKSPLNFPGCSCNQAQGTLK
ncbi:hypothetical protein CAPTEDRAFT_207775 [Capitella teleta]|uniref:Uncharacterized protein n=1 Tax=Capitella teleta TaxID=283909 RepID=R7TW26_CAPTE|nr:hypothetical protein CAPTEDRAFT_207775 [Capitella teleta]|eukprot:ELT98113.1 hypothetical protein CAPTEDRAFT_207775 [Capitella teleta]